MAVLFLCLSQMENRQNPTNAPMPTSIENVKAPDNDPEALITPQQQIFIDYKAVGGYITNADDMVPKKMTMQQLASLINVNRDTLYEWQKKIPNFWDKVNTRRREIGTQERLSKVHDTWYLKAVGGSFPHLQLWLANFDPNFRMPAQKVEHELGNTWAALAKSKIKQVTSERVDAEPNNPN